LVHRYWLVAIIGAYAAALALRPIGATFQFLGNPIILEFFLGAIIACTPVWRLGAWAVPCGVVMLACAGIIGVAPVGGALPALRGDEGFWRVLIYGVPAAMIVYGTLQVNTRESVWTYLGSASYSLYLVHIPILLVMLILWRTYSVPPDLIIIFGISTSLLFSWQIHERFEKPIAFYLRYRLRQRLSETRVAGRQSQIAVRSIGLRKVAPPQPALRERDTTMLGVGPAEPFL
jgi:exopolysaccharide production protein ExoZ